MRVIIEGDLSLLKKEKQFRCERCGCIWYAEEGEYKNESNQIDGSLYACQCPTCKNWTYTSK